MKIIPSLVTNLVYTCPTKHSAETRNNLEITVPIYAFMVVCDCYQNYFQATPFIPDPRTLRSALGLSVSVVSTSHLSTGGRSLTRWPSSPSACQCAAPHLASSCEEDVARNNWNHILILEETLIPNQLSFGNKVDHLSVICRISFIVSERT